MRNYRAEVRQLRENACALMEEIRTSIAPLEEHTRQISMVASALSIIIPLERRLYGLCPRPARRKTVRKAIALLAVLLQGRTRIEERCESGGTSGARQ